MSDELERDMDKIVDDARLHPSELEDVGEVDDKHIPPQIQNQQDPMERRREEIKSKVDDENVTLPPHWCYQDLEIKMEGHVWVTLLQHLDDKLDDGIDDSEDGELSIAHDEILSALKDSKLEYEALVELAKE